MSEKIFIPLDEASELYHYPYSTLAKKVKELSDEDFEKYVKITKTEKGRDLKNVSTAYVEMLSSQKKQKNKTDTDSKNRITPLNDEFIKRKSLMEEANRNTSLTLIKDQT
jgi:hypothetical protein